MGHKVNPIGFRLGYIKDWGSRWFTAKKKDYVQFLAEDIKVRDFIKKTFQQAAVSKVEIERAGNRVRILIFSARPGIIIGRRGSDIDKLRDDVQKMTNKEVFVDIKEVKKPACDAQLVSENIAFQLEKRIAFKRAMKKAIQQAMTSGAQGIKIACSGRLGGAEMSRIEKYREGKVPLHTLRADIDYGFATASTTYGSIGIKTWVYHGDIIVGKKQDNTGDSSDGVNA